MRAKNLLSRLLPSRSAEEFDAGFYRSHYEDLRQLSARAALKHYLEHGKGEGRFPSEAAYRAHREEILRGGFDPAAYRFYNKDLMTRFDTEEKLLRHYIQHGMKEGRQCRFPESMVSQAPLADGEKWQAVFSVPEFLAWCGHELAALPRSRKEAIKLFVARGIERLWPISFEYAFDPAFVRANRLLPDHGGKPDAELYRAWLEQGFPAGVAPNEAMALASFLGAMPFPRDFDWSRYARRAGLAPETTRSQALMALFDAPAKEICRHVDLMGSDAPMLLQRAAERALAHGGYSKAGALLDARVATQRTGENLALLGDAHRGQGNEREAIEAWLAAIDEGEAPLSAFLQAATLLASHQAFDEAFGVLRRAYPAWRHRADFARTLHKTVHRLFEHASAAAHRLYNQGVADPAATEARGEADRLLAATLDQIKTIYLEMDDLPAATGGNPNGHIAILANLDLRQCAHYRVEQKALQFEAAGIPVRVFPHDRVDEFLASLVGARAAIFYRVAAVPDILRAILHADHMDLPTYYEVDDLIFDAAVYPDPLASFEGQISEADYAGLQFGVPLFRYALALCRKSIASTPALAERMQAVTRERAGLVLRNGLDRRNETAIAIGAAPIRPEGGRVRIFYGSGTKAHNADFNSQLGPVLTDLMTRFSQVELVIVGHLALGPPFAPFAERITSFPVITDLDAYWSLLASCHINLAVLDSGPVADCKSEIKWLEAAVLQVPSVVSTTRTYREVIDNGVDGYLAGSAEQWRDALAQLILDADVRVRIGANARTKALRDYGVDTAAQILESEFGASLTERAPPATAGRRRVLLCNVFFAPQSYGGATRVVEDNVCDFVARHPDLEVAVFCSDEEATVSGRLLLVEELGVPVYRLSTARGDTADAVRFVEAHAAPFERVLDHFRPDIIHFHCIQHLGATITDVARRRAIPYVVTMHDAWWISDHQFLIDGDGIMRWAGTDLIADAKDSAEPAAAIARRQRLASLLGSASAILTVSGSFANLLAAAGIGDVRVIENGAPGFEAVSRASRADGRVALGHVGGRTAHKGAELVEACLRRGDFPNLHLTMVDGRLAPGQSAETIWGTTPVTLTGPLPHSRMAGLYSRLDVLLAPSTWPESFGLVTREAADAGLWVIASKLGAIGEEVEPGSNGFVVDVTTAAGLREALAAVNAEPATYRTSPPGDKRTPRRPADQADALHDLYLELIEHRLD